MRIAIVLFVVLLSGVANASADVQIARYTTYSPVPSMQERDPLSSVVQMIFPKNILTLDQAFDYLIRRTGYKMAPLENSDPLLPLLLVSEVPQVHREIGPITVEDAMKTLAGEPWEFVIDPVNRYVSFELRPQFRNDFETNALANAGIVNSDDGLVEKLVPQSDSAMFGEDAEMIVEQTILDQSDKSKVSTMFDGESGLNLSDNEQAMDLDAYRKRQKKMLEESIALSMRSVEMEKVLNNVMPSHWKVDIQVDDPTIRFAKFDITSQNTRKVILQDFLSPLGLKIDFYPAIQPQPLAVVSGK